MESIAIALLTSYNKHRKYTVTQQWPKSSTTLLLTRCTSICTAIQDNLA